MVKFCVFDTETTDKPPYLPGKDWNERSANDAKLLDYSDLSKTTSIWEQMLSSWPSIIQLSYIIYDTETPNSSKIFNKYIDIPDNIVIAETAEVVHHINKEKIRMAPAEKKTLISDAVKEFMIDIMNNDVVTIVGHNIQFDRKMIISEVLRLANIAQSKNSEMENQLQFLMNDKNFTCTMNNTASICKIQIAVNYKDKKTGEDKVFYKVKSPKLVESYQYYFGYSPHGESLHDALIDVILCLRVFMKYKYNEDICGKNEIITAYIKEISPEGYVCNIDSQNIDTERENIKLELIEEVPVNHESTNDTIITTNTITSTKTKRKKGGRKSKKQKTKRRRSKRIAALSKLK